MIRLPIVIALIVGLLAVVPAGLAVAQTTSPTVSAVSIDSDPGADGGYAIGAAIKVGLTFSEAVTVTGAPQLSINVGGQTRTAAYAAGSGSAKLVFSYTVAVGDEDTDGIAVVANSLARNGGTIRAGATSATLTHAALQASDHKVDGIAPTVTVGGETRTYVPPDRLFNVVFYFSEAVYGLTDSEITVTNGTAHDVKAILGAPRYHLRWPRYTRWEAVVMPAAEGPITVTLQAGAAVDVYGNGNTAPGDVLSVIAGNPVMVEVTQATSDFAEGGRAEFLVTRSRDNGAIPVSLSLNQSGDFLTGAAEVSRLSDTDNPLEVTVAGLDALPTTLEVTFEASETRKRIALLTEDDRQDEADGSVTLSVAERAGQYKYIPGMANTATAMVRDDDVAPLVSLFPLWTPHPFTRFPAMPESLEGGGINFELYGSGSRTVPFVIMSVTEEATNYLDLDGEGAIGYEHLGNGRIRATKGYFVYARITIPLRDDAVLGADGAVTITVEPDPALSYRPGPKPTITVQVRDNDSPSTVSISGPEEVTEGASVSHTVTRTWALGENLGALTVNVKLTQAGDYIAWPTGSVPDSDGAVSIPVVIPVGSLTATLELETVDDEVSDDAGSLTATLVAGDGYNAGDDGAHTTRILDDDPPTVSVVAVAAEIAEGASAQYRFTREGDTSTSTRVGVYVTGLPKIMTAATEEIVLTSDNEDLSQRLFLHGAWVDYILEFAAGETEKILTLTTEADSVNEGDGWLAVNILQRTGILYSIGTRRAQVHVEDDDIPTVSLTMPVGPTGLELSSDGTTWLGTIPEATEFTYGSTCTGVTEFSGVPGSAMHPVSLWILYSNHPAFYGSQSQSDRLGNNYAGLRYMGPNCDGRTVSHGIRHFYVGPENGELEITLAPLSEFQVTNAGRSLFHRKVSELRQLYAQAAMNAEAEGMLITEPDIFHTVATDGGYWSRYCSAGNLPYCPEYRVGTVNKIRLTITNRDPSILIKAESPSVIEGQPARFILERGWATDLLELPAPQSETVVYLRASQDGEYITGALPTRITFGRNETRKVIELPTVDDEAFSDDGSVTIELLPDTSVDDVNLHGKYSTWSSWLGHTPTGGRSDQATVTIANNDDKPGITIAPASATEGDSGSADMTFTVTLAKAVPQAVTVNYATSDGTATAGQDYTAISNGSVTIAAEGDTVTFTVSVTGDETDESNETFNVTISLPSGAIGVGIIGGDTATVTGTIMDDDPVVVTVAPKKATVTEGEDVVFMLTRTGVTDEGLDLPTRLGAPGRLYFLYAKFEAGATTTELTVPTEDNDVVDYPSERDYTIQLYGDGEWLEGDDERYTPGSPDEATVAVQDNDTLVVVTVEAVKTAVNTGESAQFRFRRTGSTTEALTISFKGFDHPSSGDAVLTDASVTFLAGNDTAVYTNDVTSNGNVNPDARAHTVLIYGDAGRGGLHGTWIAGDPNRATVVVAANNLNSYIIAMTASYPGRAAADDTVIVEYTVTNLGTRTIPGFNIRETDGTRISTIPDRDSCDIRDPIPVGESKSCSGSFLVTDQDVSNGKIEFNATARNGFHSSTLRVYIRVVQPVEFGFTTADTLSVMEGPSATASLAVTRTGRLDEAVTVAYRLRPHGHRPATLGEDFADSSSTARPPHIPGKRHVSQHRHKHSPGRDRRGAGEVPGGPRAARGRHDNGREEVTQCSHHRRAPRNRSLPAHGQPATGQQQPRAGKRGAGGVRRRPQPGMGQGRAVRGWTDRRPTDGHSSIGGPWHRRGL